MEEYHVIPKKITIPFSYTAGRVASRFFTELKDNKKIMGVRCRSCKKVIVPPQLICVECFEKTEDWIEVGPGGVLLNYTVVESPEQHYPIKPPFIMGIIRLDGADTNLIHFVKGIDVKRDNVNIRLVPKFAESRTGSIRDIEYFEPEKE
jgi:uncharacterized OB-fold protein